MQPACVGKGGHCVINRVWAVGSLRGLFRYNFSLVWVLVLDLGGLSGAFSGKHYSVGGGSVARSESPPVI